MAASATDAAAGNSRGALKALLIAGSCLLLGACAQTGAALPQLGAAPETTQSTKSAADNRTELQKATEYWGKAYAQNTRDAQTALNYARNLKAMGEKRQALAVLQQASIFHSANRDINAEYGRLALEFDQVSAAQKLLEQADDPTNPDWRVISARGTVLAKQGRYQDAIPFYERALTLAPDQASVLNNLALAHAMEGNADKAEPMLKRAAAAGGHEAQVNQNLALVLSLQGKYDEAKLTGARALPPDKATANADYVRRMVKLEAKPLPKDAVAELEPKPAKPEKVKTAKLKGTAPDDRTTEAPTGWATQVAASKPAR